MIVVLLALFTSSAPMVTTLRVGIVGAGISGASTAHYLRELFGDDVELTVFEQWSVVGGRMQDIKVGNGRYEAGASILHPSNQLMIGFRDMLGLEKADEPPSALVGFYDGENFQLTLSPWTIKALCQLISPLLVPGLEKADEPPSALVGFYDGENFQLTLSPWTIKALYQLISRYRYDVIRVHFLVSGLLKQFARIYNHHKVGYAFSTVETLLDSMSTELRELMDQPFVEYLKKQGFSQRFIAEFAHVATRVNYGQPPSDMQAFAGAVSLAACQSGLWAVKGGNRLIVQKLLKKSEATLKLNNVVTEITKQPAGEITVSTALGEMTEFDYVVLAVPMTTEDGQIELSEFSYLHDNSAPYHRTVATMVSGDVAAEAFHLHSQDEVPPQIFSINRTTFYNSICQNHPINYRKRGFFESFLPPIDPVDTGESVYKVFSGRPLTNSEREFIFRRTDAEKVADFAHAYPEYKNRGRLPSKLPFEIGQKLYHTSVIEWAASAMETGAIAGRNVALLIWNRERNAMANIDPFTTSQKRQNVEL